MANVASTSQLPPNGQPDELLFEFPVLITHRSWEHRTPRPRHQRHRGLVSRPGRTEIGADLQRADASDADAVRDGDRLGRGPSKRTRDVREQLTGSRIRRTAMPQPSVIEPHLRTACDDTRRLQRERANPRQPLGRSKTYIYVCGYSDIICGGGSPLFRSNKAFKCCQLTS
jgi:hypothetical protein